MAARSARNARDRGPPLFVLARVHPAVKSRAVYAEQLGGLAHIAARDLERRLDVAALPRLERFVEIEAAGTLELPQRLLDDRAGGGGRWRGRLEVELRFQVGHRKALSGVLRGEADHDVAQLAHVARKVILLPARGCLGVELEGLRAGLSRRQAAKVLEQQPLVAVH